MVQTGTHNPARGIGVETLEMVAFAKLSRIAGAVSMAHLMAGLLRRDTLNQSGRGGVAGS